MVGSLVAGSAALLVAMWAELTAARTVAKMVARKAVATVVSRAVP